MKKYVRIPSYADPDLRAEIDEFVDEACEAYFDYNQCVEDVRDEFGVSKDDAESAVWNGVLRHQGVEL